MFIIAVGHSRFTGDLASDKASSDGTEQRLMVEC
jgi:hypothetical protein